MIVSITDGRFKSLDLAWVAQRVSELAQHRGDRGSVVVSMSVLIKLFNGFYGDKLIIAHLNKLKELEVIDYTQDQLGMYTITIKSEKIQSSDEAWEIVRTKVADHLEKDLLNYPPALASALKRIGGASALRAASEKDMTWKHKEFVTAYSKEVGRG